MTKIAGVDVLLKVKDKNGDFIIVGGQTETTLNREREEIDTTDKTSGGYSTRLPGIRSWSVDLSGFVILGDPNESFDLLEDAYENGDEIAVDIRVGESSSMSGRNYRGKAFIMDFPLELPQDAAVTFSMSIAGNGKLDKIKGVEGNVTPPVDENPVDENPADENPVSGTAPTIVLVDEMYMEELGGTRLRFEIAASEGVSTVYGIGGTSYSYDGGLIVHEEMVYSNGIYSIQAEDTALNMSDLFEFEVVSIPSV